MGRQIDGKAPDTFDPPPFEKHRTGEGTALRAKHGLKQKRFDTP
jgi:hypothetical protein